MRTVCPSLGPQRLGDRRPHESLCLVSSTVWGTHAEGSSASQYAWTLTSQPSPQGPGGPIPPGQPVTIGTTLVPAKTVLALCPAQGLDAGRPQAVASGRGRASCAGVWQQSPHLCAALGRVAWASLPGLHAVPWRSSYEPLKQHGKRVSPIGERPLRERLWEGVSDLCTECREDRPNLCPAKWSPHKAMPGPGLHCTAPRPDPSEHGVRAGPPASSSGEGERAQPGP